MGVNDKQRKLPQTPGKSLQSGILLPVEPPEVQQIPVRRVPNYVPQTGVPVASAVRNLFSGNNVEPQNQEQLGDMLSFIRSENRRLRTVLRQTMINLTENFDPEKFDPTNVSFEETCKILTDCDLNKHVKFVRDTILKYSLCIRGFPDCPDEDLMLAVYFYFEEKFKVKAIFELCVRFDNHHEKNLVGVIFDSIKTRDEILAKAEASKRTKVKIFSNAAFHWILDGFCGP